jgi:predicted amidohydrolase
MSTDKVSPWLPEYVAKWFDDFEPHSSDVVTNRARQIRRTTRDFELQLRQRPHTAAKVIDEWIDAASDLRTRASRLDAALHAASRAFAASGITRVVDMSQAWVEIRTHFVLRGNLLRTSGNGFLLPGCEEDFQWKVAPPLKRDDLRFVYPGFNRAGRQKLDVSVTYVPDGSLPIETLRRELSIGVVPLVASIQDFDWIPIAADPPRFRVALKNPDDVARQADQAIEESARKRCDIVVFPELCFGDAQQVRVGETIRRVTRAHGGYPWLVVAGSAHAPIVGVPSEYHNRALVFDATGRELLRYHKLHPYEFSVQEQERYGLATALDATARLEDIVTTPRQVGILQTAIGRVAVLICEDIWNLHHFLGMTSEFAIDWLLVPVLDGVQHARRWTAINAAMYAEHGTSVVVATSCSLFEAHRLTLQNDPRAEQRALAREGGVGLLSTPSLKMEERIRIFRPAHHAEPSILTLRPIVA